MEQHLLRANLCWPSSKHCYHHPHLGGGCKAHPLQTEVEEQEEQRLEEMPQRRLVEVQRVQQGVLMVEPEVDQVSQVRDQLVEVPLSKAGPREAQAHRKLDLLKIREKNSRRRRKAMCRWPSMLIPSREH